MRKYAFGILFLFLLLPPISLSWANPFTKNLVCVPKVIPSSSYLEFTVREDTPCAEGESYMRVVQQSDGVTVLMPAEAPLAPDTQKDLEEFKKYYGIDR